MQKKLVSSTIAAGVAISAAMAVSAAPKPNAAIGLDNPLDEAYCQQAKTGMDAGWYDPNGDDFFAGDTKYGGDLEVDADLFYGCEAGSESFEGSETAIVDVDLSRDDPEGFFYYCDDLGEAAGCHAHIGWDDLEGVVDDAAADHFSEAAGNCESIGGIFFAYGATLEGVATFGVKEMNPGHGHGKQNYEKAFATCEIAPFDDI